MHTMRSMTHRRTATMHVARCIATGLLIGALAPSALATPNNPAWETGTGTIDNNGGSLTITPNFDTSIMSWGSFNIGIGQQVEFVMPNSSSRILNRINSNAMTMIQGTLLSNGHVYLINPNGITFSSTSVVNAGRIYAAGGMMSDADFLNGIDRFTNLSGVISNSGQITGGEVHLIGDRILNTSTGTVDGGLISFSTGDEVVIQRVGDGISLRINDEDLGAPTSGPVAANLNGDAAISNMGTVQSSSNGPIHLAAGDMYGLALLNGGTIQSSGGSVDLSARGGAIHNEAAGIITTANSSGSGGDISITAPALVNRGMIDASTSTFAGGNSAGDIDIDTFANALFTDGSQLRATANYIGDGGEISVEASRGTVTFAEGATAHAKGGFLPGSSGGTVSISGEQVAYYATTKVGASGGEDGRLQVDVRESFDIFTPTVTHNDPAAIADLRNAINVTSRVGDNVLNMFDGHVELYSQDSVAVNSTFNLRNHDLTINADRNVLVADEPTALRNLNITADMNGDADGQITLLSNLTDISMDANFTAPNILVLGQRGNGGGGGGSSDVRVTTGGSQVWDGPVQLGTSLFVVADGSSTIGDITFLDDINGGHDLVLNAVGTGRLNNVGDIFALNSFDLTAQQLDLNGNRMFANNDANFTATDIFALGQRGNGGGGGVGLLVTTGGSQNWDGSVQLETDLMVVANGNSTIGDITFTGDINGGHDLVLDSVGIGRLVNIGNTDALNMIDLTAHLLELSGSEVLAVNDIMLNAGGRDALHDAATVFGSAADLRIESENGNIRMGQHEAFSHYGGDLTLRALNGEIAIGDINTFGDMTIDAPVIRLLLHDGGDVLLPDGSLGFLAGVHYLAGGDIDFSSTPILGGLGSVDPIFASAGVSSDEAGTLTGFEWVDNEPVLTDDFFDPNGVVLNLIPNAADNGGGGEGGGGDGGGGTDTDPTDNNGDNGGGTVDPPNDAPVAPLDIDLSPQATEAELNESTTIAAGEQLGVLTDENDLTIDDPTEGPLTLVTLADLSIEMERVADNPQDQLGAVSRSDVLANYPVNNVNPETGNIRVKERRLNSAIVEQTLLGYQEVLSSQPGDVLSNIEGNNTTAIGDSLQSSWTAYATAESDPTAGGFRTYIEQTDGQDATRTYVEGLRTVFKDLGRTGVTGYELGYSRDATAQRILDSATTSGGLNSAALSSLLQ